MTSLLTNTSSTSGLLAQDSSSGSFTVCYESRDQFYGSPKATIGHIEQKNHNHKRFQDYPNYRYTSCRPNSHSQQPQPIYKLNFVKDGIEKNQGNNSSFINNRPRSQPATGNGSPKPTLNLEQYYISGKNRHFALQLPPISESWQDQDRYIRGSQSAAISTKGELQRPIDYCNKYTVQKPSYYPKIEQERIPFSQGPNAHFSSYIRTPIDSIQFKSNCL
jgi:hypothetical protein